MGRETAGRRAAEVVRALGGAASWTDVVQFTSEWSLRAAVREHELRRLGHGRYGLPELPAARRAAEAMRGVLSHETAAAHWLLETLVPPTSVHVTVPKHARRLPRKGITLHYADVDDERVTDPLRTVLDCARTLPFREALAIADSALRRELVSPDDLIRAAEKRQGAGRGRVLRAAGHADGRAANPFESALRAIVIEAGVTGFEPQLRIPGPAQRYVDLGNAELRIVLEADGYETHGTREGFRRDRRRYTDLAAGGWLVLAVAWEHVMFDQKWVTECLLRAVHLRAAAATTGRRASIRA